MSPSPRTPATLPTEDRLGPIPEENLPGHHPEVEQDKPSGPPPGPRLYAVPSTVRRFPFRFEGLMVPFALAFGVPPRATGVTVDDEDVSIAFGLWHMRFPLDEVVDVEETGDYWLPKVAGPPHVSLADRGITFATNRHAGLCIRLRTAQAGPYPLLRHPGVTVTVHDLDGLADALTG
jgi:hypothetical protein